MYITFKESNCQHVAERKTYCSIIDLLSPRASKMPEGYRFLPVCMYVCMYIRTYVRTYDLFLSSL
jgi:hypothetical protein